MAIDYNKAKDRFRLKGFEERNESKNNIVVFIGYVSQIICITFGFLGVKLFLETLMPSTISDLSKDYVSKIIAVCILVVIETIKRIVCTKAYDEYLTYRERFNSMYAIAFVIVLISVSISKNGMEQYYKTVNSTPDLVDVKNELRPYEIELQNTRDRIEQIKKTMIWDDTKTLTGDGRKAINIAYEQESHYIKSIDSVRTVNNAYNEKLKAVNNAEVDKKASLLSYFVALIDILFCIMIAYNSHYMYESFKSSEDVKNDENLQNFDKKNQKEASPTLGEGAKSDDFIAFSEKTESVDRVVDNIKAVNTEQKNTADRKIINDDKMMTGSVDNSTKVLTGKTKKLSSMTKKELLTKRRNLNRAIYRWHQEDASKNRAKIDNHLDLVNKISKYIDLIEQK